MDYDDADVGVLQRTPEARHCEECGEEPPDLLPSDRECPVCGTELTAPPGGGAAGDGQGAQHEPVLDRAVRALARALGVDLPAMEGELEGPAEGGAGGRRGQGMTAAEIAALDHLTLSEAMLHSASVHVIGAGEGGGPDMEATLANFAPFPPAGGVELPLSAASPALAMRELANAGELGGTAALCQRGGCSFAHKALRLQDAGAAAVLVAQTHDDWPYHMTDTKGEADGRVSVPVLMVRREDGERLRTLAASGKPTTLRITSSASNRECLICACELRGGERALRLPCGHLYHAECITRWLQNFHSTCPLCRRNYSTAAGATATEDAEAVAAQRREERAAATASWYT